MKQIYYDCPTCGYTLTEDEVTKDIKHWSEEKKCLKREFEAQIDFLKQEIVMRDAHVSDLEEQIEKMKLCDNCKYQNMDDGMYCRVIHKGKKEWCFKVDHPRWELKE